MTITYCPIQVSSTYCIIAVSSNFWGRGKSVAEAVRQLKSSGGKIRSNGKDVLQLRFILGDDKAYVNGMGDLMIAEEAQSFKI